MNPKSNEDGSESRQSKHVTPIQFNDIRDHYHTIYEMRRSSQNPPTYELPALSDPIGAEEHIKAPRLTYADTSCKHEGKSHDDAQDKSIQPQPMMVQQSEGESSRTGFTGIFELEHIGRELCLDRKGMPVHLIGVGVYTEDLTRPEHDTVVSKTIRNLAPLSQRSKRTSPVNPPAPAKSLR
jgi:hypothetical protein